MFRAPDIVSVSTSLLTLNPEVRTCSSIGQVLAAFTGWFTVWSVGRTVKPFRRGTVLANRIARFGESFINP